MNANEDGAPPSEPSINNEKYLYNKVVFGHSMRDFDIDQCITFFYAKYAGIIGDDVEIVFNPSPSIEDINNSSTLVIEGISNAKTQLNNKKTGNFDNGANDDPAAFMFFEAFQADWKSHQNKTFRDIRADFDKLRDLALWIRSVDSSSGATEIKSLPRNDLKNLVKIFHAVKDTCATKEELLEKEYTVFLHLLDPERTEAMDDIYFEGIRALEDTERANNQTIREHIQDHPNTFEITTTNKNWRLVKLDIRGLDIQHGAMSIALEKAESADLIMLIDDERNDDGEVIGSRFLFSTPRTEKNHYLADNRYLQNVLAPCLTRAEALFGKGYEFTMSHTYGGHPRLIGSNALGGSFLNPDKVWIAIQDHFDANRYYTDNEWNRMVATRFAAYPGIVSAIPSSDLVNSEHQYTLPQRKITLTVKHPEGGENLVMDVLEEDIDLYFELLNDVEQFNLMQLNDRGEFLEPAFIAELREERACKAIPKYIEEKNITKILSLVNHIRPDFLVNSLSAEQQIQALELIAESNEAILEIWDTKNERFQVTSPMFPPTLKALPEQHNAAKYSYESVPSKIDTGLITSIYEHSIHPEQPQIQQRLAESLIRILSSDGYKQSHSETIYDQVLPTILRMMTDVDITPEVRSYIATTIIQTYGSDMKSHWRLMTDAYSPEIHVASVMHKETFGKFIESLHLEPSENVIPGVPGSNVRPPNKEKVSAWVAEQLHKEDTLPPIVTILTEIQRPSQSAFLHHSIDRLETDEFDLHAKETIHEYAGIISVLRPIDQRAKQEHIAISEAIINMVIELDKTLPEGVKIRIIRGGYPNEMTGDLTARIALEHPKLVKRIIWGNYEHQTGKRYDSEFLATKNPAEAGLDGSP